MVEARRWQLTGPALRSAASERTLHKFILPLPSDASEEGTWVDRLLVVMQYLEDATQKALFRLTGIHDRRPTIFETYLNTCEKYNVSRLIVAGQQRMSAECGRSVQSL